ncbi:MAG: hypothetical protein HOK20_05250 [Alphaproteobacteria bacterium]|nr:hypothetical protein [Alphaproteobacteria bacterium]MBT5540982.1 hypothetical protein [Alphaproteobacteria bacterium]
MSEAHVRRKASGGNLSLTTPIVAHPSGVACLLPSLRQGELLKYNMKGPVYALLRRGIRFSNATYHKS